MKTIGLLGGMSWESTIPYYRHIHQTVGQRLGGAVTRFSPALPRNADGCKKREGEIMGDTPYGIGKDFLILLVVY